MDIRKYVFEFTPLGKADKEVRNYLETHLEEHQVDRYHSALQQYRHVKVVQTTLKILLYASLITSIAATIGFREELEILERVASYLGTSIIFFLFVVTSYITMIRRETYHVQREILISQATKEGAEQDMPDL